MYSLMYVFIHMCLSVLENPQDPRFQRLLTTHPIMARVLEIPAVVQFFAYIGFTAQVRVCYILTILSK